MYKTIFQEGVDEIEIKKSRFIGYVKPVFSEDEAQEFIEKVRKQHPTARHHCSAFVLGEKGLVQRYDDDKEPSGTAGVPMLDVLKKEELTNLCAVVVRYFGGTLLGTGGLVRAYTKATQLALEKALIVEMAPYRKVSIAFDYGILGSIEYFIHQHDIPMEDVSYLSSISCTLYLSLENAKGFLPFYQEITSGQGNFLQDEEILLPERNGKLIKEAISC